MRWGILLTLVVFCAGIPRSAEAWWNKDWEFRQKISIARGPGAIQPGADVAQYPVLVRLNVTNFHFNDSLESGADLRVVSSDDKTLLPFHVTRYDWIGQVASLWIQLPTVTGADAPPFVWIYYGNPGAPAAADPKATFDPNQTLVFHFSEREGTPQDATGYGNNASQSTAVPVHEGLIDTAIQFDGSAQTTVPASSSLTLSAGGGFTFSAWVKPQGAQSATLFRQQDGNRSLTITLEDNQPVATVVGDNGTKVATPAKGRLAPDEWHHLAVTVADRMVVYIDGVEVSSVAARVPALAGDVTIGNMPAADSGFHGLLDEVRLAKEARSVEWLRLEALLQRPDAKVISVGDEEQAHSGGGDYFATISVLAGAVSLDGWAVIALIGLLGFISGEVAVAKTLMLRRAKRANERFIDSFRKNSDALALGAGAAAETDWKDSPLFAVYSAGTGELGRLQESMGVGQRFSSLTLESVRAVIDSSLLNEANRITERMVLLTLAVSGAPFLGLFGTVVGIMITFATIALKGDVNINTIAPGIAAALTATAAGMLVAIPALFSYNVLMTRIREITTVMELFRDELLSKIAARYA
jgi:biopolymer transport protein ExbB